MIGRIVIVASLLAAAAVCRFWIFRLQDKDIPADYYQRRARLEDCVFPASLVPPGFRMPPALPDGKPNPAPFTGSTLGPVAPPRPGFPSIDRVTGAMAAVYVDTLGDQVLLVACQYGAGAKGEEVPAAPAGYLRQGNILVTAVAANPLLRERLLNSLSERLASLEKNAVKLNKLKTIGNVLLKLFMNILVGAFAVMLALFLVKYFLIVRQVEG